jgi:hypothetical protein
LIGFGLHGNGMRARGLYISPLLAVRS